MSPKHTEESYEDTLARLDIGVENQADKDTFLKYLKEELGIKNTDFADSLWTASGVTTTRAEHGIHGVTIKYDRGVEVRYGIQGMPGLWGWASVQAIAAGEEW
jgi:hypothetical protein